MKLTNKLCKVALYQDEGNRCLNAFKETYRMKNLSLAQTNLRLLIIEGDIFKINHTCTISDSC